MGNIKVLDKSLIEKIAAGEVIERPVSVVKELVENSIDAKADEITIELEDGGKSLILIKDNGIGMDKDDIILSIKRHATSKIVDENDLFDIHSLGFRGEALASISIVSELSITTKRKDDNVGIELNAKDGKIVSIKETATNKGTKIEVKNLFYNLPVRAKFLKTIEYELKLIADIITRYALAYPKISFKLTNNDKVLLASPKTENALNNIAFIYNTKTAKNLIHIDYTFKKDEMTEEYDNIYDDDIKIEGYVSNNELSFSTNANINIFVNGRFIKSNFINSSIYDAYKTFLMKGKHPFAFLNITINPVLIDVNVHPAKTNINFRHEALVKDCIFSSIKTALEKSMKAHSGETFVDKKINAFEREENHNNNNDEQNSQKKNEDNTTSKYINKPAPTVDDENMDIIDDDKVMINENDDDESIIVKQQEYEEFLHNKTIYESQSNKFFVDDIQSTISNIQNYEKEKQIKDFRNINIVGQLFRSYILAEKREGNNSLFFMIDQHAAEERVNYEKLMKQIENKNIEKQKLLAPMIIELTPTESIAMLEHIETAKKIGFEIEEFGNNSFMIRSVPMLFVNNSKVVFNDIVKEITECYKSKKRITEDIEEKIITKACKSSLKANEELSYKQMKKIIEDLLDSNQPLSCPHGRPTMVKFTKYDIERLFKRK